MSKIVLTTLVSSICLASCTTLLVPKYQNVKVTMPTPESKLYCNDSLIGSGKTLTLRLKRDRNIKELRVETKGYRDIHSTVAVGKANSVHILNIPVMAGVGALIANAADSTKMLIGLGAGAAVGLYGTIYGSLMPRGKDYRPIVFSRSLHTPRAERTESQKNLSIGQIAINLPKGAFTWRTVQKGSQFGSQQSLTVDSMGVSNTIFTERLNAELIKCGFAQDASASVLKSVTSQLSLRAEITQLDVVEERPNVYGNDTKKVPDITNRMHANMATHWQVMDAYGSIKFDTTIATTSGVFAVRPDILSDNRKVATLARSITDALNASMHTLLLSNTAQQLLINTDKSVDIPQDVLAIQQPTARPSDLEEAITTCVTVAVRTQKGQKGHGSGFFISQDGYIVTNYHVVADASSMEVIDSDGKKFTATLIRSNKSSDLALLKIDATLPFAFILPTTKNYTTGMDVYAIGTPSSQELGQTISKGIVSGDRKGDAGNGIIQTDVSVSSGNSGGVLLSKEIGLIGVVNAKLVGIGVEGIAFAIPAKDIFTLLNLKY